MRNESIVHYFNKIQVVIVAKVYFLLFSSAEMFVGWNIQFFAYNASMCLTGGHLTSHLEHEGFRVRP